MHLDRLRAPRVLNINMPPINFNMISIMPTHVWHVHIEVCRIRRYCRWGSSVHRIPTGNNNIPQVQALALLTQCMWRVRNVAIWCHVEITPPRQTQQYRATHRGIQSYYCKLSMRVVGVHQLRQAPSLGFDESAFSKNVCREVISKVFPKKCMYIKSDTTYECFSSSVKVSASVSLNFNTVIDAQAITMYRWK